MFKKGTHDVSGCSLFSNNKLGTLDVCVESGATQRACRKYIRTSECLFEQHNSAFEHKAYITSCTSPISS